MNSTRTNRLWPVKMAWRDSRGSRSRLFVFVISLALGVAALVSINSFGYNLRSAIDSQAASLLGADLEIESDSPFSDSQETMLDQLEGDRSEQISFTSMALFEEKARTRLVAVRAIRGSYPYYGNLETEPATAANEYLSVGGALIDGSLAVQMDVTVGDSMKIGGKQYPVIGILKRIPRETAIFSALNPRVFIPLDGLDRQLLSLGSQAEYVKFFRFNENVKWRDWIETNRSSLEADELRIATIDSQKAEWSELLTNVYRFLGLTGLIALLLGSIGVASSVYVYIKQRRGVVALLRCIGASNSDASQVYLIQAVVMGLVGSILGVFIGLIVQVFVPSIVSDFVPVDVAFSVDPASIFMGLSVGVVVTTLFALIPLVDLRRVSPMEAIRSTDLSSSGAAFDKHKIILYVFAFVSVGIFTLIQAPTALVGGIYFAGLAVVFGLIVLQSVGTLRLARWATSRISGYTLRQSVANLQRPNNQTLLMMLSIGFATFLISALFFVQTNLVNQVKIADQGNRPNTIFFDIQTDQIDGVEHILVEAGLPVVESVPIVTMKIESVNGKTVDELAEASLTTWAHTREYRSTYRDFVTESEIVEDGEFIGSFEQGSPNSVPVSVEEDVSVELGVEIGDPITFDVQGVSIDAYISSIRIVDWQSVRTNFFFVFPTGILEEAPTFYVAVTRVASEEESGLVQSKIVSRYPNVSAIDLRLILSVFEDVFGKISFVLRFMAFFSLVTGLIIVGGSVFVSRYSRIQESILFRTLGASTKQLNAMALGEYLVLGFLASTTGVLLALVASALVSIFVFEIDVSVPIMQSCLTIAAVMLITGIIGVFSNRGISVLSPLEILRRESL